MQALKINIVRDDSNAHKSGLLAGDVIVKYNETHIGTADDLSAVVGANDSQAKVKVIRNDRLMEAIVAPGPLGVVLGDVNIASVPDGDPEPVLVKRAQEEIAASVSKVATSTTDGIPGKTIVDHHGVITAECAIGMNIIRDLFAQVTDIVGGRSGATQNSLRDISNTIMERLKSEAERIGANAVVGIRIDFNEFSGQGKSMLFAVGYGTAVTVS